MAFISQLTSGQLDTLRGTASVAPTYYSAAYVSVCPNTIKFQALINQSSFTASYASVTFDTVTTGAYTDIKDGMRVFITPTTDLTNAIRTGFTGRARMNGAGVVATSTVLNVNESSTSIQNNWVITVIDDYPLLDRLGRQVNGVQYIDYDIAFRKPKPIIYNVESAYAQWVTAGVYTIDFAPSAVAVTSGASISSWLWNVADGTITSGSTTTQNITATFPPGFRWVYLTVTDSNGSTRVRKIPVWAHDPVSYPPTPLQMGDLSVTGSIESGYSATCTAWAGVSTILDNTYTVFWSDEKYQDLDGSLLGDNINFVGRLRQSSDSSIADLEVGQIAETKYTIEGVLEQLARIEMLPYELDNAGVATAFFQVVNLTPWRAVALMLSEFSTFLETHSLYFDDTTNTYLGLGFRTQNGNILAVINDLYYSLNGAMQVNPAAQAQFVRDLRMQGTATRNAATTVINFDTRDLLSIDDYQHDNVRTIGRLRATGGAFNSAVNQYATYESLAPGIAQDYAEGSQSLDRQVLAANQSAASAQSELNTRAGYAFARAQSSDKITVTHPDGYHSVIVPSLDTWYTFTLDGTETVRGIVLTSSTRWLCVSVTISHDAQAGEKTVSAVYAIETTGASGQSVVYPPVQDTPYTLPSFPPFDPFPAFPTDPSYYLPTDSNPLPYTGDPTNQTVTPGDGNTVVNVDVVNNVVFLTTNYISGGQFPTWVDITPPNAAGQFVADAVFVKYTNGVYVLYNDGTNSTFAYCSNPFAAPPVWTETAVTGLYTLINSTDTPGGVYIRGESAAPGSTTTYDFTASNGGWNAYSDGYAQASYSAGVGWSYADGRDSSDNGRRTATIEITIPAADVNTISFVYDRTEGSTDANYAVALFYSLTPSGAQETHFDSTGNASNGTYILSGSFPATTHIILGVVSSYAFPGHADNYSGSCLIKSVTVTKDGTGSLITRYSSDYGATFGSQRGAGNAPSLGAGLDTIKIGSVALVGSDAQVQIATSGGTWANYGTLFPLGAQPNALFIPRTIGTLSNVSSSTPVFLAGSGTLSTLGETLWIVRNSGSLFTAISPKIAGTAGLIVSPRGVAMGWNSGTDILAVAKFGSSFKLCVSNNTGSTWKFTSLQSGALMVTTRHSDLQHKQAFVTQGSLGGYTPSYQIGTVAVSSKYSPGQNFHSIDVYN